MSVQVRQEVHTIVCIEAANHAIYLSDVELMKKQHSLKVNINKTVNRLQYQALKKLDTPNPMPESPLRSKLEAKLANQRQQYTLVTQILESRK